MMSAPTARSVTFLTKSFTTRKFTSASSSAMRTSRIAALTSASLSLPLPFSFLNAPCSLSVNPSNAMECPPEIGVCQSLGMMFSSARRASSRAGASSGEGFTRNSAARHRSAASACVLWRCTSPSFSS